MFDSGEGSRDTVPEQYAAILGSMRNLKIMHVTAKVRYAIWEDVMFRNGRAPSSSTFPLGRGCMSLHFDFILASRISGVFGRNGRRPGEVALTCVRPPHHTW